MGFLITLIACAWFSLCSGDSRLYAQFVSPFNFGKGVPALRDVYPFISSRQDSPQDSPPESFIEFKETDIAPSVDMNIGIIPTNRLKLNSDRMGIKRVGFSCGIPGTGEVDPFELGPRFAMPARRREKRPRKGPGSKKVSVFADALDLTASRKLESRSLMRLKRTSIQTRGSHVARPSQFCWQAKIRVDHGNGTSRLCGGTIIGSKTILTAAHCIVDRDRKKPYHPRVLTVTIGDETSERLEDMRCVEAFLVDFVLPHPSYDVHLEDNDIGLVILGSPIRFDSKPCACKLCLKDKEPEVGQSCVVAGDGRTRETREGISLVPTKWDKQRILRQTFDSRCAFVAGSGKFTNLENFICASDPTDDASCQGDDGSSFVCFDRNSDSHYSAGIVSFSAGCGKDIGSQYTKVKPYLSWIENNSPEFNIQVQRGWNHEIARSLVDI